jgi:hypothetical protein
MGTEHTETVVEKAVAFVKDVLGIPADHAPDVEAKPEYSDAAPEVTAENAMRPDPNAFIVNAAGQITPRGDAPLEETVADRLRRDADRQQHSD